MESTWETRDLPVLEAAVRWIEEHDGSALPQAYDLAPLLDMDKDEVGKALLALEGEYIDTYATMGGLSHVGVQKVHPAARRAVGQWPTAESLADRITAAVEEAADRAADPEEQSRIRQFGKWLGSAGRDVLVDVTAAVVVKSTGVG